MSFWSFFVGSLNYARRNYLVHIVLACTKRLLLMFSHSRRIFREHTNEWKKTYWILNEFTCLAYFLISYFPLNFVFSVLGQFHTHFVRIHTFARNFSTIWNQCRGEHRVFSLCRNISSRAYRSAPFFIVRFLFLSFFLRGFTFVRSAFIIAAHTHDVFVIRKSKYLVKVDGKIGKHETRFGYRIRGSHSSDDYNLILVTLVWLLSHRCRNRLARIKSILIKWINDICFCESAGGICGPTACMRGRKSNWRRLRRWDERNVVFLFFLVSWENYSPGAPIAE